MKSLSDINNPPKLHTSDIQGLFCLKEYIDSTQTSSRSYSVVMDEGIRQSDPMFKYILHNIRQETMDTRIIDFY